MEILCGQVNFSSFSSKKSIEDAFLYLYLGFSKIKLIFSIYHFSKNEIIIKSWSLTIKVIRLLFCPATCQNKINNSIIFILIII